jgi:hypothetical protein
MGVVFFLFLLPKHRSLKLNICVAPARRWAFKLHAPTLTLHACI